MDHASVHDMEERTRRFAVAAIHLQRLLMRQRELRNAAGQLSRAANSVAANHRAMSRARSTRECAAKLHTVHEEADEAAHWLSVLRATNRDAAATSPIEDLLSEAVRLRNFFGRARATTRRKYFR